METWSNFSGSDVALALIGLAGFVSVAVVIATASSRVNALEIDSKLNQKTEA